MVELENKEADWTERFFIKQSDKYGLSEDIIIKGSKRRKRLKRAERGIEGKQGSKRQKDDKKLNMLAQKFDEKIISSFRQLSK